VKTNTLRASLTTHEPEDVLMTENSISIENSENPEFPGKIMENSMKKPRGRPKKGIGAVKQSAPITQFY